VSGSHGENIFSAYDRATKRGLNYDLRKEMYEKIPGISMADFRTFFDKHVKGKPFTYVLIAERT
jgi:hypothetical protein